MDKYYTILFERCSRRAFLKIIAGSVLLATACSNTILLRSANTPEAQKATPTQTPNATAVPKAILAYSFRLWGQEDIRMDSLNTIYSILE